MNHAPAPQKKSRRKKRLKPWLICVIALGVMLVGVGVFAAVYLASAGGGGAPPINTESPGVIENPNPNGVQPPPDSARKSAVYTFLIVGLDHPKNSRNTDVLMLASFNTESGEMNVLQIPRDIYVDDPLMQGEGKGTAPNKYENRVCKINNVFNLAYSAKKTQSPAASDAEVYDYAIDYLKNKISALFCVPIDFHISFNTTMFRELLEVVCPITVDVPFNMDYDDPWQDLHIHLKAGVQELNAEQAEGFMRFRQNNKQKADGSYTTTEELLEGDFTRVDLQKIALAAVFEKVFTSFSAPTAQAFVGSVINSVNTNLTLGNCTWFALRAFNLFGSGAMSFSSVRMYDLPCRVPGTEAYRERGYTLAYGFMEKEKTLTILNRAFNVYTTEITANMLGYTERESDLWLDHSDTEGKSIQEIIDNPPKVRLN